MKNQLLLSTTIVNKDQSLDYSALTELKYKFKDENNKYIRR